MSPQPHIPSHRKPRSRTAPAWVVRTGVAGGALGTIVATAASAATAATAPSAPDSTTAAETTSELPAVPVHAAVAAGVEQSAETAQQAALRYELQTDQESAAAAARADAERAKKAQKAEEAKKAREAAEREQEGEQETASRSTDREPVSSGATGSAATVIDFLQAQVGKPYVLGATGPSAYDCSSLTQAAFRTVGIDLPRVSQDQSTVGTPVAVSDVQPGDLVFWGGVGSAYHVAVYIGDGKYLDAANPEKGVVVQEMSYYMPTSAVRVL